MDRNYTGDILNFGLAREQYSAQHPEKADKVRFVIVGDDVAVGRTQGKIVGRRCATYPLRIPPVSQATLTYFSEVLQEPASCTR